MKVLKIISIALLVCVLAGLIGFLTYKNVQLNKSYESATQQVTQLQAKLDAIGTFTDVYTVKTSVEMGAEIKESDLTLQTVPTSSVPSTIITEVSDLVGKYYRIEVEPGTMLTDELVVEDEYKGSLYDRDIFLDSLPVGTKVGDYIDIRMVLPDGEEFVVFAHRRVNARYENAVKMNFDEKDLWIYSSLMVDKALYSRVGLKVYATRYVDPGAHDKTVAFYPVREEVVSLMNVSPNLTEDQRKDMYNENLRTAIESKLAIYSDKDNKDASIIASAWQDEHSSVETAQDYYEDLLESLDEQSSTGLVDPNSSTSANQTPYNNSSSEQQIGSLESTNDSTTPNMDGQTDSLGNGNVVPEQNQIDATGENLFDDETPIQ